MCGTGSLHQITSWISRLLVQVTTDTRDYRRLSGESMPIYTFCVNFYRSASCKPRSSTSMWYPHRPIIQRFSDISWMVLFETASVFSPIWKGGIRSSDTLRNIDFLNKKNRFYKTRRCDKIQVEHDHMIESRNFMKAVLQP